MKLVIRKYRYLKNISQEELAARSDVTQPYINYLENNNEKRSPTLKVIKRIAVALDICPIKLIVCGKNCEHCERYKRV